MLDVYQSRNSICSLAASVHTYQPIIAYGLTLQVYENTEVKKRVASSNPYGKWVKENLRSLKPVNFLSGAALENDTILRNQQ